MANIIVSYWSASGHYDEADYIRNYDTFLKEIV